MSRWLGGGASASGGGYGKLPTATVSSATAPAFSGSIQMEVGSTPSNDLVTTNHAYCSPKDALLFHVKGVGESYALVGDTCVLLVKGYDGVRDGVIALSSVQRQYLKVSKGDRLTVERYTMPEKIKMVAATLEVDFVGRNRNRKEEQLDAKLFSKDIIKRLVNQVFTVEQKVPVEYCGVTFVLKIADVAIEGQEENETALRGLVTPETTFIFESAPDSGIKIINQRGVGNQIFKHKELNFQKLGIGGLDAEFADIFRRAFASRVYPPEVISRLGICHVKGMLLHGPPGTGKTLIARQIGKMLNGREPKVVNGPEVLSKYVGQTEENIRQLFGDAESDQKMRGDKSDLHIIIFDEIDAICKTRGSTRDGTGVHDSIVNQLLTKIDGVDALNNILLIGMTNRKDMLDEALLRPGRLEVQIEIGLPDEKGRVQILQIHTSRMRENSFLSANIRLEELALRTKNFSGAELEGLVKSAVSFALDRQVDVADLTKPIDEDNIKVTMDDFLRALDEIQPAFGAATSTLDMYRANGILDCGDENKHIREVAMTLVEQVKKSDRTALMTCLLEGPPGSGKTALAATIAIDSDFPFIKIISAENMIGYSEASKCSAIAKVFEDAYKSPFSIIILDDIERLLEFVDIGPRFSNVVLQAILVLLKRLPQKGRKLMVLGTTSMSRRMQLDMDLIAAFNVKLSVPNLQAPDIKKVLDGLGVFAKHDLDTAVSALEEEMPIKRLLMLVEMAAQGKGGQEAEDIYAGRRTIDINYFFQCLRDLA